MNRLSLNAGQCIKRYEGKTIRGGGLSRERKEPNQVEWDERCRGAFVCMYRCML